MIIQSDSISLNSRRSYEEARTSYTSYSTWDNITGAQSTVTTSETSYYRESGDSTTGESYLEKDNQGDSNPENAMRDLMNRFRSTQNITGTKLQERIKTLDEIQRTSINYLLYLLFGKKIEEPDLSAYNANDGNLTDGNFDSIRRLATGGHYFSSYSYSEKEETQFHAKGTAITADGRELNFNINLTMSRSFTEYASTVIDFGEPNLCDPLVINLGANVASVSDQNFYFDLDADGKKEEISALNSSSGFLALDKNGDGVINDGSELFGTASGNGFADLAAYDSDKNGWIDEADEIFDKLLIWTKDSAGNDKLCAIGKAGVGAIYLGNSETNFSIKTPTNETSAIIRKTGFFFYEDGGCGTLNQLDFAI